METVNRGTLKEIHPELLRYPIMAVRCHLRGIEPASASVSTGVWSDAASKFVENLCGDDVIRCSFLGAKMADGALPVELVVSGKNVADELCRAGVARPDGSTPRVGRKAQNAVTSPNARNPAGPASGEWCIKALWVKATKNPDVNTRPLARPFACLLALLTHSLALHCFTRALIHLLAHLFIYSRTLKETKSTRELIHLLAHSLVGMSQYYAVLNHSVSGPRCFVDSSSRLCNFWIPITPLFSAVAFRYECI